MKTKQLIHVFYKIYVISLVFLLTNLVCMQYINLNYTTHMPVRVLATLENFVARPPFWQDWDVKTDVAILSSQEVAGFLKNNLTLRKEFHEKMTIKDVNTKSHEQRYLVMRFVDDHSPLYGKIKCYFSCFSHSITNSLKLRKGVPTVIILPFPSFLEKDKKHPCKARLRWGMIEHAGK